MNHPGVGDARFPEAELSEPREPLQMRQPGIGDGDLLKAQSLERDQRLQMTQPLVGERCPDEGKLSESI